jgi:hypothetical protein
MTSDNNIGSLSPENFGYVESILMKKGLPAPIIEPNYQWFELHRSKLYNYHLMARECVENCLRSFSIKAGISYCFVDAENANAFAARNPAIADNYFIIFHSGLASIGHMISTILHDEGLCRFLDIPSPSKEGLFEDFKNVYFLTNIAFRWLVFHEIGHIKNGHLHLPVTAGDASTFEAMQRSGGFERNVTLHTLEMDADSFASGLSFADLLGMSEERNAQFLLARSPITKVKSFIVAIYALLRNFDFESWTRDKLYRYSHPPAAIRIGLLTTWGTAFAASTEARYFSADEFLACLEAVRVVEEGLIREGVARQPAEAVDFLKDDLSPYVSKLLARWARIRPTLEKHLLGGQLAVAQVNPA